MLKRLARVGACFVIGACLASLLGCATSFYGNPRFPGGASACYHRCKKINMEMASFVYVGEYSTACACKPKTSLVQAALPSDPSSDDGAVVAAGAGVELQRRAAEARAGALGSRPYK